MLHVIRKCRIEQPTAIKPAFSSSKVLEAIERDFGTDIWQGELQEYDISEVIKTNSFDFGDILKFGTLGAGVGIARL